MESCMWTALCVALSPGCRAASSARRQHIVVEPRLLHQWRRGASRGGWWDGRCQLITQREARGEKSHGCVAFDVNHALREVRPPLPARGAKFFATQPSSAHHRQPTTATQHAPHKFGDFCRDVVGSSSGVLRSACDAQRCAYFVAASTSTTPSIPHLTPSPNAFYSHRHSEKNTKRNGHQAVLTMDGVGQPLLRGDRRPSLASAK